MTIETPLYMQEGVYSARQDRMVFDSVYDEGVVDPASNGLKVSQRGAGANMSVDVTAGKAVITGDDAALQGKYFVRSTALENVVIAAADPTNPRIDVIVLEVRDNNVTGGGFSDARLRVIQGIPAGAPAVPATPGSAIALARVAVAAGAVSIVNANITDVRAAMFVAGEVLSITNAEVAAAAAIARSKLDFGAGLVNADIAAAAAIAKSKLAALAIVNADVDAAAAIAQTKLAFTAFNSGFTPVWKQGATTITKTVTYSRYVQLGKLTIYIFKLVSTGAGSASGVVTVDLPFTAAVAGGVQGSFQALDAGTRRWTGEIQGNTTSLMQFQPSDPLLLGPANAWTIAATDEIEGVAIYEAA